MRIYYLLLLLCFLVKASVFSQGIIDNDSNKIIFKAPNENFNDIELQSFHGLTRFGVLDTINQLMTDVYTSYRNYKNLLDFKSEQPLGWDDPLKDINNKDPFSAEVSSSFSVFSIISKKVMTKEGYSKYYENRDDDIFDKNRKRRSLVTDNLNDLKKWTEEFLPNEEDEAYYVTLSNVVYDLENQGLLISLDFSNVKNIYNLSVERIIHNRELNYDRIKPYKNALSGAFLTPESPNTSVLGDLIYKPKTNYERILSSEAFVVFYEMSPEMANPILQDESLVYVVRKIKFYKDFTFNIASPIIELYKDIALTQKIGELDYNDLIFY